MSQQIFGSVVAQDDNLGDIAIRQVALDWLPGYVDEIVIFVGSMPDGYISAFDFPPRSRLVTRRAEFALRYLAACVQRTANLLFAPGPYQLRSGNGAAIKSAINLVNIVGARISGGVVVAVGRAFRGNANPVRAIERASLRMTSIFVCRDTVSAGVIGMPVLVAPDMAFGIDVHPRELEASRPLVAFSLRSDRPVDRQIIAALVTQVKEAGLRPVFVTQVRRDNHQHLDLGKSLHVEVCAWTTEPHREQRKRVNEVYSSSHTVISNRLHALIFGLHWGAIPVGIEHSGSDKLRSTLDHLVPMQYIDARGVSPMTINLDPSGELRQNVQESTLRAYGELELMRKHVLDVFSAAPAVSWNRKLRP